MRLVDLYFVWRVECIVLYCCIVLLLCSIVWCCIVLLNLEVPTSSKNCLRSQWQRKLEQLLCRSTRQGKRPSKPEGDGNKRSVHPLLHSQGHTGHTRLFHKLYYSELPDTISIPRDTPALPGSFRGILLGTPLLRKRSSGWLRYLW